jgi:hypothetical protein
MKEIYPVPDKFKEMARISEADYFKRYQDSIEQPEVFWAQEAKILIGSNHSHRLKIQVLTQIISKLSGSPMVN